MKRTSPLRVLGDATFDDGRIVIHPNAGADLGLMTAQHQIRVFFNSPIQDFVDMKGYPIHGTIQLSNNCKPDTIEMSLKKWTDMGRPKQALLIYDNHKLLIYGKTADKGSK
jgi:hypothetical protein